MNVADGLVDSTLAAGFTEIRATAEDLKIIEANTRAKFRYPPELGVIERIMIRNLRLMLEGRVVAHPLHTRFSGQLNGTWGIELEQILNTDYHWSVITREPAGVVILDQTVRVPKLSQVARVRLDQDQIDAIKSAFTSGAADGHPIHFNVSTGDRVRMFLPDRVPPDMPLNITPWDLEGVYQKGLDSDGEPLDLEHPVS